MSGARGRLLGGIVRAFVRLVDDSGPVQRFGVEGKGEPLPDVDHLQPYGLTGVPPVGARTTVFSIGSAWDHLVAFATGHTDRPRDLTAGDVTLYSAHAARLDLRADGIRAQGPRVKADGYVDADGGFRKGGLAGLSGTLVITVPAPPSVPPAPPLGVATVVISGGIVTSVTATGVCVWTPG